VRDAEQQSISNADAIGAMLTTPVTRPTSRSTLSKRLDSAEMGSDIATVSSIIPASVPAPKIARYSSAMLALLIVASTNNAMAAEPASPCTTPIASGRSGSDPCRCGSALGSSGCR
jgi:hypothetical protein